MSTVYTAEPSFATTTPSNRKPPVGIGNCKLVFGRDRETRTTAFDGARHTAARHRRVLLVKQTGTGLARLDQHRRIGEWHCKLG
jgi:hypothetical protein